MVHTQGSVLFADSLIDSNKINSKVQSESRLTLSVVFCFGLCFVFCVLCFVFCVLCFVFCVLRSVFIFCGLCVSCFVNFVLLSFYFLLIEPSQMSPRSKFEGGGEGGTRCTDHSQRKRVVFESRGSQWG